MAIQEQIEQLWASLLKLGACRLIALGVIGVSIFAMTGLAGYFLSRPASEVLYAGLDRQDVGRIAGALKEADIPFDVSSDGGTVLVRYGETARARMLLAEKGLPNSPNAGNELYDKLGSLGLTSYMQEVTRVSALEGELARTISADAWHQGRPCACRLGRRRLVPADAAAAFRLRRGSNRNAGCSRRGQGHTPFGRRGGSRNDSRGGYGTEHRWRASRGG